MQFVSLFLYILADILLSFTRKEVKGSLIAWIYKQSQANVPLSKILERLKAA